MSIGLELNEDEGRQPSEEEIKVEPEEQNEQEEEPYEYVFAAHDSHVDAVESGDSVTRPRNIVPVGVVYINVACKLLSEPEPLIRTFQIWEGWPRNALFDT